MKNQAFLNFLYLLFVLITLWNSSLGSTLIIPDDYPSVQAGIDAAQNGDTVLIRPGTYMENLLVESKNLVIGSFFLITSDTSYISQTILDGNQSGSVIRLEDISPFTKLSGLTITNGRSTGGGGIVIANSSITLDNIRILNNISICGTGTNVGGGIACVNSQLEIIHFKIKDNIADCNIPPINPLGGGLYARNSTIQLLDGTIINNQAFLGGALYMTNCDLIISDVTFKYNYAAWPGGTICAFDTDMDIRQTIFDSNSGDAGTIYADNSQLPDFNFNLINCLFVRNSSVIKILGSCLCSINSCTFAANSGSESIQLYGNADLLVLNSIFWNEYPDEIDIIAPNSVVYLGYSDIKDGKEGVTNNGSVIWTGPVYDTVPGFMNDSSFCLSDQSPCIGAGIDSLTFYPNMAVPEIDLDSNIRPYPINSMPDLGAYENLLPNPLTGIDQEIVLSKESFFKIFPNPAGQFIRVDNQSGETVQSIQFNDISGRELLRISGINLSDDDEILIETREINSRGVIFVILSTYDKKYYSKFIINNDL
jgi:hypothetical protein